MSRDQAPCRWCQPVTVKFFGISKSDLVRIGTGHRRYARGWERRLRWGQERNWADGPRAPFARTKGVNQIVEALPPRT